MQDVLILKNAVIFDGVNEEPLRGKSLVIADGKIDAICDGEAVCTGDVRIIDLDGAFVSPGFIDCHMHMLLDEVPADKNRTLSTMSAGGELYPNADCAAAFLGVDNCRKMLEAGFTTVMDGGGRNFIDCALREAIQKGFVPGPNYLISGKQLTTNKAHFIGFSMEPYGPYGMRKAIRDLMWWSVDFVKMQLSPPIRMVGRNSNATDFTVEEITAAIDEAHNYGTPVHAHLRGAQSIKNFLSAGGDVVVHGTGIDDEGIELMLKHGKIMLPTLLSPSPSPSKEMLANKTQPVIDLLAKTAQVHWESARRTYKAGVTMAFSTDCGTLGNHIGTNALEFENLVAIGMSNAEALRAATSVAARVTGREDRIGRILPGYQADITVLGSSPLEDIKATSDVRMTLVNGRIMYNRAWAK